MTQTPNNHALGAILGACVGDAAGSVLEFMDHKPTPEEVQTALSMPGGGIWTLAPGQITDDGELTLCLAQGLTSNRAFSLECIALRYSAWILSPPFDIGNTTRNALGCFQQREWALTCKRQGYAAAMTQAAFAHNMDSKANGSMMRATPLGVWGHKLPQDILVMNTRQDARLSHPNASCADSTVCYVLAIASLMQNPGDGQTAFDTASTWADQHACTEVQTWLKEARDGVETPYTPQIGFVRIAFTWAMHHLLRHTDYTQALQQTLLGGGDTDTNACIVGGLLGALHGADAIPETMRNTVLQCDTRSGPQPRLPFLDASQIPALANQLLALAPS